MPASVRAARPGDLRALQDVEVAAGALFASIGMDAVAQDEPPRLEDLADDQRDGRAWVSVDDGDLPVGYLLVDVVDGGAHVQQVTVHPTTPAAAAARSCWTPPRAGLRRGPWR